LDDGYALSDIAVLTRKKQGELDLIAQALQNESLAVVTSESFLLINSPKVRWILSCLAYIMHPENLGAQIQLISDTEYLFGGESNRHSWWPKYCAWEGKKATVNMDLFFEENWSELPSMRTFPEMLHLFAGQLSQGCPGGEDEYTECLLVHLHQKSVLENETLSAILDWIEEKKEKLYVSAPSDVHGVQIMTVHKSKGLQFPVVIVPRFSSGHSKDGVWVALDKNKFGLPSMLIPAASKLDFLPEVKEEKEKQRLDDLNVAYVATTRPEDRLYLALEVSDKADKDTLNDVMWRHVLSKSADPTTQTVVFGAREKKSLGVESKVEPAQWSPLKSLNKVPDIQIRFADRAYLGQDMQRKGGDFVHECLSVIRSAEDSEEVIAQLSKLRKPLLDDVDHWADVARSVVHNQELQAWFSGSSQVAVEHDIVTPDGKWLRPDRMRLEPGAYAILDFKTGAESEEHHEQLHEYKRALSVATREEVKAHLYYTLTGKLVEVI
jgi:ATP-dependent exoDNAse (exonuclease V) beta subunit